jgi:hypothetical protein
MPHQARRAWLRRGNTHLHCYNYPTSEIRTQSRVKEYAEPQVKSHHPLRLEFRVLS